MLRSMIFLIHDKSVDVGVNKRDCSMPLDYEISEGRDYTIFFFALNFSELSGLVGICEMFPELN